jgi:hypothetical protein
MTIGREYITLDEIYAMWQDTVLNEVYNFGKYCKLMSIHYKIY